MEEKRKKRRESFFLGQNGAGTPLRGLGGPKK